MARFITAQGMADIVSQNFHFFTYLTERYAWQLQLESLVATFINYNPTNKVEPLIYLAAYSGKTPQQAISDYIIDRYKITDPRVLALRDLSISKILLGSF